MKVQLYWVLLLCLISPVLWADVGEITYFEGDVEIMRDGDFLSEWEVDIGTKIQNLDQIGTSSNSHVTVTLIEPQVDIQISENTTFIVERSRIESRNQTTVGLMAGSIAFNVKKLSGNQEFFVKTESVALGVRGTRFNIGTSPGGDILVSCDEGSVVCYDPVEDQAIYAEPGTVVEKKADELFRAVPVAVSSLEAFKEEWIAERVSAFKANALKVIRNYAVRYNLLFKSFNEEYESLMTKMQILEKWFREDTEGITGGRIEMMQEKKEIINHLFRIRGVLFIFERVYFRLWELYGYFQEGFGRGEIEPGISTAAFYRSFLEQRVDLLKKIGRVRFIIKLYAKRNDGSVPIPMR